MDHGGGDLSQKLSQVRHCVSCDRRLCLGRSICFIVVVSDISGVAKAVFSVKKTLDTSSMYIIHVDWFLMLLNAQGTCDESLSESLTHDIYEFV